MAAFKANYKSLLDLGSCMAFGLLILHAVFATQLLEGNYKSAAVSTDRM